MPIISGKALGRKKPLFADWSFPLPPELSQEGRFTLRMLIEQIVRQQVAAFQERQADAQVLRVLSSAQIDAAAETGRIMMGQTEVGRQEINLEAAVGNAWQAFEDGIFLVVLDDIEQKDLDCEIHLNPESRVTFLRLTLLAGG